jgi:hypothetical protein
MTERVMPARSFARPSLECLAVRGEIENDRESDVGEVLHCTEIFYNCFPFNISKGHDLFRAFMREYFRISKFPHPGERSHLSLGGGGRKMVSLPSHLGTLGTTWLDNLSKQVIYSHPSRYYLWCAYCITQLSFVGGGVRTSVQGESKRPVN